MTFSNNVLLKKYSYSIGDRNKSVTYKSISQEHVPYVGRVFIDARIKIDFKNRICAVIISCNYRLIMPVSFMNIIKDTIIERFNNFSDFKEDQEGWCYCNTLDSFIENKINNAIHNKEIKAFSHSLKMPENYSITADNIFSLSASKTLYKGRSIDYNIQ